MKNRPVVYAQQQYAQWSEPMYVVQIEFAPASFETFASHAGIPNIPAGVIESTIEDFSAVSQSFNPETGASRIGSLSVLLGDIAGAVTDAFQARLAAGTGVRDKTLRFYKGFKGLSFNDFEIKWTQIIHEVTEDHARYAISCSDLQRALRTDIFKLKTTVLDATLSATATTATVADTSDFVLVEHGTSYSHGPSATWGYFKLDDEIIGYTGKTAITFTGLDRGLFNTQQAEHVVDPADPPERRPEIEEYVYLEMPIPKLIKALQTGVLHGQAGVLPAHWNMGIDITLIDDAQFTGIGLDLWDPANDAVGLIARFTDIGSINGKRFLETECYLLAQIFSPVLADGKLGLKRFTPALATAAHVVTLNESNVQKHSSLKHSMREVFNRIVLNWSWMSGEFRRQTIKLDTDSIAKHGQAPIKIFNFRGLATNIATKSVLTQIFDAIRDRFSAPPLSMTASVSKSLDRLELGDVCLVQLPNVRDMAAATVNAIDRAFEIRQISENRKRLTLRLSGSSAEALPVAPSVNALPNAFYNQEGTELSTVVTITAGVTAAGTFTLVGDPLLKNSVFYYIGNLTIAATTLLQIDDNVQLRIRGFLTINGDIDGIARGLTGVVDGITTGDAPGGRLGFFGATGAGDGAEHDAELDGFISRPPGGGTIVAAASLPHLNLSVSGNTLNGLPADLRGCSGGPGGKLVNSTGGQVGAGGTGGDGGSGLLIVCRGMSFGGGASIDLSGGAGLSALQQTLGAKQFFGGGGAGGAPGALYVLVDGNQLVPDVGPIFTALGGNTPLDGTPMAYFFTPAKLLLAPTITGLKDDTRRLDDVNWTDGAFRVQFIPVPETPVEDLPPDDLTIYYILATNGNAIHNGVGTLTVEAHRVTAGTDELLSAGTIKLFDPADLELTVANGYVAGSDGYTGILDSGDIINDIVITLKDGATGQPLDTITLVDIADGATGSPGADGGDGQSVHVANVYKRSASPPSTPAADDGSYNFTTNVLTPPAGWSVAPPAGTDPLYVSTGSFSIVGTSGTDTTVTWTAPDLLVQDGADGAVGDDGLSVHVANVYKRNATQPATPAVDDGSYNFTTKVLTPPAGWSVEPPAGSNPLWVSTGSFSIVGPTGTDTTVTWTSPDLLVRDGLTSLLTNEAHVLPANFDGTGYDLSGSGGTHKVFDGTTEKTTSATHSVVSPATKNGLTISVVSGTGVYSLSGASWTTDFETFTLRAVFGAVTFDKVYTISKAKQGTDGGCALDTLTNDSQTSIGSGTRVVGYQSHSDGTIDTKNGSGSPPYVNKETWKGVCANTEYECRMNKTSGVTPSGSALATWLPSSSIRNWSLSTSGGNKVFDGTFQKRRTSDNKVLKTVTIHFEVESTV